MPVHVIGNWSRMEGGGAERTDAGPSRTIVYPAAFAKSKNHRLLVDAFSSLAPEFPDWTLELYGAGNAPFDLPRGVRAMGFREDLSSAWARCAFLAFPSLDEGFPLSIVDAAAFGKPALTVRDWIGAAASGGGVVAGTSVREYAAGMRKLMSDPALCGKMGDAARHFCSDSYSKAAIMAAWEALLRQCAG